ncbi:MAG: hypothetical protein HYU02_05435 [Thaumarchaeota archaeon]|nr:hypothetical protein [Nitrososphaerota archaeon]
MVDFLISTIIVTRFVTLLLGAYIIFQAYRGYNRNRNASILVLSIGLGCVTLGTFVEGVLYQFLQWGLIDVHEIESMLNVVGFALMLLSLKMR